jgi:hypothetical protein
VSIRLAAATTATATLLLLPGLAAGPSLDPAVFLSVGERMQAGHVLYLGAWDHKPPGIYLLYAAMQATLPFIAPWLLAWLVSVVVTSGAAVLVGAALRRIEVSAASAAIASLGAAVLMGEYLMALGGGLTEPVACLPVAAALYLATGEMGRARLVAIGVLLAASVIVSLQVAVGALAVAAIALARAEPDARGRTTALLVGGVVLPVAVIGAWLVAQGALGAALDAVFGYAAAYRAVNAPVGGALTAPVASWTVLAWIAALGPSALGALRGYRAGGRWRVIAVAACAWILVSVATFVVQGRFIAHYAIPLAIPTGVLAGLGLERLTRRIGAAETLGRRIALAAPWIALGAISIVAGMAAGLMEWRSVDGDRARSEQVAAAVREASGLSDTLFVWGNQPRLYLDAGRLPATRYPFLYPLSTPGYVTEQMVDSLVQDLEAQPPAVIVDAGSAAPGEAGFLPLLIPRPIATDGRDRDVLDPARQWIEQHYEQQSLVDGWVLYVFREPGR